MSESLLVVAASPAADVQWQEKLRRNAYWLVSTLGWIPTDKNTAQFVETWSHLDNLTEFALNAGRRDDIECYHAAAKMMFDWALKAGTHHTGWGTLARWLTALVGLSVTTEGYDGGVALSAKLTEALLKPDAPSQDLRERAANALLETVDEVRDREFDLDILRRLLAESDRGVVKQLLQNVAEILMPGSLERHKTRRDQIF